MHKQNNLSQNKYDVENDTTNVTTTIPATSSSIDQPIARKKRKREQSQQRKRENEKRVHPTVQLTLESMLKVVAYTTNYKHIEGLKSTLDQAVIKGDLLV